MIGPVWVVQDRDTGRFLCPDPNGDVGFTRYLGDAGRFLDAESAIDTARFQLGDSFVVTKFYDDLDKCKY